MPTLASLPANRHELWTNGERKLDESGVSLRGVTLDTGRAALFLGDEELRLRRRTFEVLTYLVRNSGRQVWSETFDRDLSWGCVASDKVKHAKNAGAAGVIMVASAGRFRRRRQRHAS